MNENRGQSRVKSVIALASLVPLPWSSTRSRTLRQQSPDSSHNATHPGGVFDAVHRRPSTLGRAFDTSRVGTTGPRIAAPLLQAACSHSATHPPRSRAIHKLMTSSAVLPSRIFAYFLANSLRHRHAVCRHDVANGGYWEDQTNAPKKHLAMQIRSQVGHLFARHI